MLLTGCGAGSDARAEACSALDVRTAATREAASRVLRQVVAADGAALETLDADDPLAARFRGAKTRAEQALAAFAGDPLRSRTMSPTATILPTTRRLVAETRALRTQLCD